jgi:hypothetical protein
MKMRITLAYLSLILLFASGGTLPVSGEITVSLSVKFILKPDGTRPAPGVIGTSAGFSLEVKRANGILMPRGFRLQVVDYLDIRPPPPAGEEDDYWYSLAARSNSQTFESAASADPSTWRWHTTAINIFVNNSVSGQCAFPGNGSTISMGQWILQGTVLHELGHFFNLRHTHSGDPVCLSEPPPYFPTDGDGLVDTINDHPCLDRDGLSQANFNGRTFAQLTTVERARVNSSWLNVMSYHLEDQLLDAQMNAWADAANGSRLTFVSGLTRWVDPNNACPSPNGRRICQLGTGGPFNTVQQGVAGSGPGDLLWIQNSNYNEPQIINKSVTLAATGGPVVIGR